MELWNCVVTEPQYSNQAILLAPTSTNSLNALLACLASQKGNHFGSNILLEYKNPDTILLYEPTVGFAKPKSSSTEESSLVGDVGCC